MKQNFKLTKDQQTLVEKNLSIVHWVIVNNIHVNPGICGLEYGDLFQEGCLWLCKAAFTYNAGQAQFSTYAKKVVKNGLLSYCRKICSQGRHISRLIIGEQGELAADGDQVDQPDDHLTPTFLVWRPLICWKPANRTIRALPDLASKHWR